MNFIISKKIYMSNISNL